MSKTHPTVEGMGIIGMVMWEGVVEGRKDPLEMGRVRVRIAGFHTHKTSRVGTNDPNEVLDPDDLPWAIVALPTTSGGMHGIGPSVHGLVEGTCVVGYFRDGARGEQPVITHVIPGIVESVGSETVSAAQYDVDGATRLEGAGFFDPRSKEELANAPRPMKSVTDGVEAKQAVHFPHDKTADFETRSGSQVSHPDVHKLARGYATGTCVEYQESVCVHSLTFPKVTSVMGDVSVDEYTASETPVSFDAKYPYNKVTETESGHVFEVDDTPGSERINTFHRAGSWAAYHANGDHSVHVKGQSFTKVRRKTQLVDGDYLLKIGGKFRLYLPGNDDDGGVTISIEGSKVQIFADEIHASATGDTSIESGGVLSLVGAKGVRVMSMSSVSIAAPALGLSIGSLAVNAFSKEIPNCTVTLSIPTSLNVNAPLTATAKAPVSATFTTFTSTMATATINILSGEIFGMLKPLILWSHFHSGSGTAGSIITAP